jgi:outer membrane protein assembly factor BamB
MYVLREDTGGFHVAAIDTGTGDLRWLSRSQSCGYLAADQSRVFSLAMAGARALELVALDADNGSVLWRYEPGGQPGLGGPCPPVPVSNDRVCWTNGKTVHFLNAATGARVWSRSIENEGPLSCPVPAGASLYVATAKQVRRLEMGSGQDQWTERIQADGAGLKRPILAIHGRSLYFTQTRLNQGATLFCMDLDSRTTVWKRSVPPSQFLLAADAGVFLRAQKILALDRRTGETLWSHDAAGCGPLTLVDGLIHFADSSEPGRLLAMEQRTGRTAWEIDGIRSCDALATVNGTGYIKSQDGIVHAIELR